MSSGLPTPEALDECYQAVKECLDAIGFARTICGERYGEPPISGGLEESYHHIAKQFDEAAISLTNASRHAMAVVTWERWNFIATANGSGNPRYRLHRPSSLDDDCEFSTIHVSIIEVARWMAGFFDFYVLPCEYLHENEYILPTGTPIPAGEHRTETAEVFARDFREWNCDIYSRLLSESHKAQLVLRSGNFPSMVQHEIEALTGTISPQETGPSTEIKAIRADASKKKSLSSTDPVAYLPDDSQVRELYQKLCREEGGGRSKNRIARDIYGDNEKEAQNALRYIRLAKKKAREAANAD